jgi:hypothetical protein
MALVCPVYFVGLIDGVYHYVGERCVNHAYSYITSASPLTITTCPGNAALCQDDGTGFSASNISEMVFFRDTANYGAPGYLDPSERFPETVGVIDQLDQNDCVFQDDQKSDRVCRIFLVRVRYKGVTLYLRIGYELKPNAISTPGNVLQNVQKLGDRAYRGDFGQLPFYVLLPH